MLGMAATNDQSGSEGVDLARYARQVRYAPVGGSGTAAVARVAHPCVRLRGPRFCDREHACAGVGYLRLVDRDFLELNNLQRQVLYDEADVAAGLPKAIAAANKLRQINSEITIEPLVTDVDYTNVEQLTDGIDVIVDGTDNFETRMLVNDISLKRRIPWVYGGCLGLRGRR